MSGNTKNTANTEKTVNSLKAPIGAPISPKQLTTELAQSFLNQTRRKLNPQDD